MSTPKEIVAPVSPEPSDNPWSGTGGIRRWWSNINDWIQGLSPAGATAFDTGWVDVPITLSGITGTMKYSRYGKIVILQLDLTGGLVSGTVQIAGNMPSGIVPSQGRAVGALYLDGGYVGVARITAGGVIGISQTTGTTRSNPTGTVVFRLS